MKIEEKVKKYLEKIKKEDKKINAFLHLNPNVLNEAKELDKKKNKNGKLFGYVFGVKSNINVRGMICNCASKTLENYRSGYDATAIKKIKSEDGLIIGMTNMDEFACGSSGESSAFGPTQNPSAIGKIPGGSSSGSAAAVAAGFCDAALGSDTGGSIRNPASHCGIVGVKPSYGCVSRYGLIDLSMSLDQIGPLAKNVKDAELVLSVIAGKDNNDTTSIDLNNPSVKIEKLKVGIIRIKGIDEKIEKTLNKKIQDIKKNLKWAFIEVEIKHIDLAVQTYYPLVYVEFFSATRRFDGRRYGKKIEENCGKEVLRRILGGKEITKEEFHGAYYKKSLMVKTLIRKEFKKVLDQTDCLIMPTVPFLPWNVGDNLNMQIEEIYAADALTCPANLADVCAVSLPLGKIEEIPTGMQIICKNGEDIKMLKIAEKIEQLN